MLHCLCYYYIKIPLLVNCYLGYLETVHFYLLLNLSKYKKRALHFNVPSPRCIKNVTVVIK